MNHLILSTTLLFHFFSLVQGSTVEIKLKPFIENVPTEVLDDFEGFFFQPYVPTPTLTANCYEKCPCSVIPYLETSCECDLETVCGGQFPLDLSSHDEIRFVWDASSDDTKYISINGTGRTRIEFQGTVDCQDGFIQELSGSDIRYEIDDQGLVNTSGTGKYVYNRDQSFVLLGKCDGCSLCEIYTRLQFDPNQDGILDMNFKSLQFSVSYDPSLVVPGELQYDWATDGYCWMRDSQSRRRIILEEANEDSTIRLLNNGVNTYKLLDLPGGSSGTTSSSSHYTTSVRHGITVSFMTFLVAMGLTFIV